MTSIDHIILGVISFSPCTGYDMKTEFEKGGAGLLSSLSFGSIYPRLKQLEEDGLIETQQASSEGRHKKIYELTAKGWKELDLWLQQPNIYPIPARDEQLLKILFWGSANTDRVTLIEQLCTRRDESLDLLRYLDEWQKNGYAFVDEYAALVFSYFQTRLESELDWIAKAITQLEGPPQLPVQDPRWLTVLQKSRRNKALGLQQEEDSL